MKVIIKNALIILILLVSAVARMYLLDSRPALNADEAAIGYNAYSLLETGLDEHGTPWPIHFQSFGDYKPGLYFYLALPFVYAFGLTELAVRFPGALLGVVNVFAIWILVRELFGDNNIAVSKIKISFADMAAFLLAISPWHIHFSRGGWEVNAATTFMTLGLFFFIRSTTKNKNNLIFSALFFVISIYTYHAARVVVPLILVALAIIYRNTWLKVANLKKLMSTALFGVLLIAPLVSDVVSGDSAARAGGVSIFADSGSVSRINELRGQHGSLSSPLSLLLHNKPVVYFLRFSDNYLSHFWGEYLFLSGDEIQRNKVPEMGLLYIFQLPLLAVALVNVSKKLKNWWPILVWLLVAPVPAALTFQSPHALRSQSMVIPLTVMSAWGLFCFIKYIVKQKRIYVWGVGIVGISIIAWNCVLYFHQYYSHTTKTYPFSSQYGAKELVEYVNARRSEFRKIYITDRYDQPYILFLFYSKYPPSDFQKDHSLEERDEFGFSTVRRFSILEFTPIVWDNIRNERGVLVAGTDDEIPGVEANVVKKIKFPNGDNAYEVVELK
ncbi:hypothetical protein C4564_04350 [Candidatus Microgenomates bacterium]|nr:MAG: hypothetical protein C4564_04350 [Candidatus Microgenomates bacterium]